MNSDLLGYTRHIRLSLAATTMRRKEWELRSFARYLEKSGKQLCRAEQVDVEAFLLSLDASNRFRRSVCATLSGLFDFMKLPQNPAAKIRFKRDGAVRLFVVPGKESVDALIDLLPGNDTDLHIRDRLMIELAYGSGLRRDELRKVNVEDLNLEAQTLRVTGKGNKTRIVPITAKAVASARVYLAHRHATRGPLLVSFFGRRLSAQGMYQICRERIGIRPHLLRHACAGHMLQNGASIRVIQELLGHTDLKATQIYTQVTKTDLCQVLMLRHPRSQSSAKQPA